jgi:N-methylhydantoinase A
MQQSRKTGPRAGFDIGGTFTDIVVAAPHGALMTYKILSIPESIGSEVGKRLRDALDKLAESVAESAGASQLSGLVHGTTVGTNALLEGKGAKAGLLTTQGFRDALELRRLSMAGAHDFFWKRSPPIIPRGLRREVPERMGASGQVVRPLDRDATVRALRELSLLGIESLAICFVNAYVNPEHERMAAALARDILPGVPLSLSHEVLPAFREYERTSTTAVNASLVPVVARYLDSLSSELSRFCAGMMIMQSNGGMMSAAQARARPIFTVESGPAAGVLAASALTRTAGIERAVAFDMGGTTVKACLIEGGAALEKADLEVGGDANISARWFRGKGYIITVPSLDIVEAGAGGGSIAAVDAGGRMKVGPESAGAVPGPVCYGRGGARPTVTDANVALGYLNPEAIAGGSVPIDRDAALAVIERDLGAPLGRSVLEAAYGVHAVANAAMMRTVRAVSTERGRDPREYTLIAFGGAGPIHAAALAEMVGMNRVCVPLHPGLFSALGLLLADMRFDLVHSMPCPLGQLDAQGFERDRQALLARARDEAAREGLDQDQLRMEWSLDMRYERQTTEIRVDCPEVSAEQLIAALERNFHARHEQLFSYHSPEPVALVNLRLKVISPGHNLDFERIGAAFHARTARSAAQPAAGRWREAYFGPRHGLLETRILSRAGLRNQQLPGPLVVEEFDSTIVVPPGWSAQLDKLGNILLQAQSPA